MPSQATGAEGEIPGRLKPEGMPRVLNPCNCSLVKRGADRTGRRPQGAETRAIGLRRLEQALRTPGGRADTAEPGRAPSAILGS